MMENELESVGQACNRDSKSVRVEKMVVARESERVRGKYQPTLGVLAELDRAELAVPWRPKEEVCGGGGRSEAKAKTVKERRAQQQWLGERERECRRVQQKTRAACA